MSDQEAELSWHILRDDILASAEAADERLAQEEANRPMSYRERMENGDCDA
jgi:hypothetical protein